MSNNFEYFHIKMNCGCVFFSRILIFFIILFFVFLNLTISHKINYFIVLYFFKKILSKFVYLLIKKKNYLVLLKLAKLMINKKNRLKLATSS